MIYNIKFISKKLNINELINFHDNNYYLINYPQSIVSKTSIDMTNSVSDRITTDIYERKINILNQIIEMNPNIIIKFIQDFLNQIIELNKKIRDEYIEEFDIKKIPLYKKYSELFKLYPYYCDGNVHDDSAYINTQRNKIDNEIINLKNHLNMKYKQKFLDIQTELTKDLQINLDEFILEKDGNYFIKIME